MSNEFLVSDFQVTIKDKETDKVIFTGKAVKPNYLISTYEQGDLLKVINGKYQNIEGNFIDYVDGYDKILIQTDEMNILYVDSKDIEFLKKKVNNTHKEELKTIQYKGFMVSVYFKDNKTIVKIPRLEGVSGEVYCDENDEFNEDLGIELAFFKAMKNYYKKCIKDCNSKINNIISKHTN